MPDLSISGLPNASALAGTEPVPIVQGGVTVKTTAAAIAALATGGVTDGDKGDITVSSSGAVWTVDPSVISNSKLANVATATFKGRTTAGTGAPEDLTVAQAKTLLNLAGTNTGDQTITLTGDVTGSGTGSFAATIANDTVNNAKSANMATATIKGRATAGTGDPEDLTATQATAMLDVFTNAAKGLVPASGGGTTNFLRADGTFAAPPEVMESSLETIPTSEGNIAINPHATVLFNGYFYVFDVEIGSGCRVNANDFSDVSYTTTCPRLSSICDGGDGFLYGAGMEASVRIHRIDPTTLAFTEIGNTGTGTGARPAICSDLAGNLFFTSATTIQKWTTAGTLLVNVTNANFNIVERGHGIAYKNGFVWVTGSGVFLLKLSPTTLLGSAVSASYPFLQTDDFAIDGTNVYIVSEANIAPYRMHIVDQVTLAESYVTLPYPSFCAVFDEVDTVWITYGTQDIPVTGVVGAYNVNTAVLSIYRTSAPGVLNELVVLKPGTLLATSWGGNAPSGGYISRVKPIQGIKTYSSIKAQSVDGTSSYGLNLFTDFNIPIGISSNYEGIFDADITLVADTSILENSGNNSSFLFTLSCYNAGVDEHTVTFDPVTFAGSNGLPPDPLVIPADSPGFIELLFLGRSNITLSATTTEISRSRQINFYANSILGNNTGSAAAPIGLTGTQTTAMLDTFTSVAKGLVPASGGGTTNFLRADGTFAVPAGGGGDAYLANTQTFTGANTFTGQVNVTRNASPGAGINQAVYVEANYAGAVGETAFGLYSRFIHSGSATPSGGEHLVGLLGRASDTSGGKFLLYGAESRVDAAGTASEYGAHFTFANFGGATFTGQSLVGNLVRSEIYTDGTYTTPLNEGANVGVKVSALVGGAIKRSFVGFDEIQNQAPIGAYNAAGSQWTKIYHDSDSGFIQVSGGTGGHLKLNPASGSYIIQSEGLGLIPLTEGLALGQTGFRWAGKFTTGEFSSTVTGTNLISTSTVRLKNYTVATLPAGTQGDTAYVTDALAPTYLTTVVGGGAIVTPVFFNGTNWVAH